MKTTLAMIALAGVAMSMISAPALAAPATATVQLNIRASASSYHVSQTMQLTPSQTIGPLVGHVFGHAIDGPNGAHADTDFTASADFGNLSAIGSADADYGRGSGSAGAMFSYDTGGAPNAMFTDRIFVSDAGLPAGAPISLRLSQSLVATASQNVADRHLFANTVFSDLYYLISTVNTQLRLPRLALGFGSFSGSSNAVISVPNGAFVNITGTLNANIFVYSPSVPGLAQGAASGHMLTQIDVLTSGASFVSASNALYAASPVPEPNAAVLMVAGLAVILGRRRRTTGSQGRLEGGLPPSS